MNRRALSRFLALACALVAPVHARALPNATPPAEVNDKAVALFKDKQHLAAAKEWEDALQAVPESLEARGLRNEWAAGAVNAYAAAFEADPSQCAASESGLRLADEYLAGLVAAYGPAAKNDHDYLGISDRRGELDQARAGQGCGAPAVPVAAAIATPPEPVMSPAPVPADAGQRPAPRTRNTRLAVGIGVSAALGVAMLGTSLALYFPLRRPSEVGEPGGARWEAIYQAAIGQVPTDKDHDMCVEGKGLAAVDAACARWNSQYRAVIATGVLAGVFGVTTAVFTGLLVRKRKQSTAVAARMRKHQVQLGAAPHFEGGAMFTGRLRF